MDDLGQKRAPDKTKQYSMNFLRFYVFPIGKFDGSSSNGTKINR